MYEPKIQEIPFQQWDYGEIIPALIHCQIRNMTGQRIKYNIVGLFI